MSRPEVYALVTVSTSVILTTIAVQDHVFVAITATIWTLMAIACIAVHLHSVRCGLHKDDSEPPWT